MNLNKLMVQACTAAILSGSAAGAMAFADDDARRAILDLRAQVAALEEQLKNAQISFATRLDNLQNQNRLLTGQVEELTNAIRQEKRSTRELYTSIDERLGKFEPREVEVNGEKVMVQPQEQAAYDAAVELLKAGDYKKAAAAFSTFGAEWPKSPTRPTPSTGADPASSPLSSTRARSTFRIRSSAATRSIRAWPMP